MDILFTGNLKSLSDDFFSQFNKQYKLILCGKDLQENYSSKNVTPYSYEMDEEEYENIFRTFHFQSVVHISKAIDGEKKVFDELERIESTLYFASKYSVDRVIYVTPNDFEEGNHENDKKSSRYVLLRVCEKLCRNQAIEKNISVTILRIPYLYSRLNHKNQTGEWIKSALEKGNVVFKGAPEMTVDFLWEKDLSDLIYRMIDQQGKGLLEMNISGNNKMNFSEVESTLQSVKKDINFEYKYKNNAIPQFTKGEEARKLFGWFPYGIYKDQIAETAGSHTVNTHNRNIFLFKMHKDKYKDLLMTVLEMLLLGIISFLMDARFSGTSQLSFLDFRLLFVLIMGMLRGLNAGIVSALVASIGYTFRAVQSEAWQIIFYNVQNWLPFATYFLVGATSGYFKDKYEDTIHFLQEEQSILEGKYIFLSELYKKALENKDEFTGQIIGYKDSFGRIYAVIKRLSSTLPDKIFYEAINVLEDILENKYIAIFSIDQNSNYARLNVCSQRLNESMPKSMRISDYPEMTKVLLQDDTFVNHLGMKEYPDYAAPIFRDERLTGMILLKSASGKQMNMEFLNKFNIVTGLVKDSLLRAIDRMELVEKATMLPGTRILNKEQFGKVLEVKKQMMESEYAEYLLLRLRPHTMSEIELSDSVSRLVRNNDVLGQGNDNEIYLLLSQTNQKSSDIISQRLHDAGIEIDIVKL